MRRLAQDDVKSRLQAVRQNMRDEGADGLVVSDPSDVRYLCGHEHESLQLLVTPRSQYLVTVLRGIQRAQERSVGFTIVDPERTRGGLQALVKKHKLRTLGVNGRLSHAQFLDLRKRMRPTKLKLSNAVSDARAVKSPGEIKLLRRAQREAERIFDVFVGLIEPGLTELHLHNRLIQLILDNESLEGPSFEPIVSSGASSWTFHSRCTNRKLRKTDCIIIDMGVRCQGYCSDMTRTVFLGKPTKRMCEVYGIVHEAQQRAIDAIRAGAMGGDVSAAAWDFVRQAGYAHGHGLGHGLGLETHDYPIPGLAPANKQPLQANMVLTVEPGIYIKDAFGVRIEDTVVVTRGGCENITRASKELTVIG